MGSDIEKRTGTERRHRQTYKCPDGPELKTGVNGGFQIRRLHIPDPSTDGPPPSSQKGSEERVTPGLHLD
jgi:hypothetical protein